MLDLTPFLDGPGLVVGRDQGFDGTSAERLGRTLATLARRRGLLSGAACVARHPQAASPLRDGVVRGLLMGGFDVKDLGLAEEAPPAAADEAIGLFLVTDEADHRFTLRFGGQPLPDEQRASLAAIWSAGDFSVGEGRLDVETSGA